MASNNAIGEGTLHLTVGADRLLAGLESAGKQAGAKAKGIASAVDQGGKGQGGGGFLKGLLGGLAGAGIFAALVKGPEMAMRAFAELEKRATGLDRGALAGIRQSFQGIQSAGLGILQKFVTAAAPGIMVLGKTLLKLFDKLSPLILGVAEVFEVFWFVAASAIEGILDSFGGLGNSTDGWGTATLNILRILGKAIAYAWDLLKAAGGVVAMLAGAIAKGIAQFAAEVLKYGADALTWAARMARGVPLVGGLLSIPFDVGADVSRMMGRYAQRAAEIARGMQDWGRGAVLGFGQSARAVDEWFNGLSYRLSTAKGRLGELAEDMRTRLTGAMLGGSAEAYATVARNQNVEAGKAAGVGKQQLAEWRQMAADVKQWRRRLEERAAAAVA